MKNVYKSVRGKSGGRLKRILFKSCALLTAGLFVLSAGACAKKKAAEPTATTFCLNEDGTVTQTIFGETEEGITQTDLQDYISDLIRQYGVKEEEPEITLDSIEVQEGNKAVKLQMTYASPSVYASFNSIDAYLGTISDAYKTGYTFNKTFVNENGIRYPGYAVIAEYPKLNVLVLREGMNISIPEKLILYTEDISHNDDGTYTIASSPKENIPALFQSVNAECSYIIFQAAAAEEEEEETKKQ